MWELVRQLRAHRGDFPVEIWLLKLTEEGRRGRSGADRHAGPEQQEGEMPLAG
jgi:hypothetical protein